MKRLLALMLCAVSLGAGAQFVPFASTNFSQIPDGYCISTEVVAHHEEGILEGMTTYRFHLECLNRQDYVSAIGGASVNSGGEPMILQCDSGWFNSAAELKGTAAGVDPQLFAFYPELQYDSYLTIGAQNIEETPANNLNDVWGVINPLVEFQPGGGSSIIVDDDIGGAIYVPYPLEGFTSSNQAFAQDDLRVLLLQVTTSGTFTGQVYMQIFMNADQAQEVRGVLAFDSCAPSGCTDESACNFDENAIEDDGSCSFDSDEDGVCDNLDECIGEIDACGLCNGPGDIYECGCFDIPQGFCDCELNLLDALLECGGDCAEDADADGICDDVDDCVGELDACGVCNGPGEIYECGCSDIPEGDCDCEGNQLDALGVCGGDCIADADADGICDDIDDCVGTFDACGVCNGPGEIYECGCANIPVGDCDCAGNVLDECGVCGGTGIQQGFCDCEGNVLDAVGVCGGDCISDVNDNGICDLGELENAASGGLCGQGTIWNEDSQLCLPLVNPSDLNLDGCVDVQDFMGHLAAFGEGCNGNPQTSLWQCGDPLEYQGYDYETVQIGEQCWFAENLKASSHQNGNGIPTGSTLADWNVAEGQGYQVAYGGLPAENCEDLSTTIDACDPSQSFDTYGLLYNNFVVIDPRGICPLGWHVGTDEDWGSLEVFLGMDEATVFTEGFRGTNQGAMIKTTSGWHNNGNGTDEVGFQGHPSGSIAPDQDRFANGGSDAVWWTPSETNGLNRSRLMNDYNNGIYRATLSQIAGAAIRCIKDNQ